MSDAQTELQTFEAELNRVERALSRLDDGSYGTCEICGNEVDTDADVLAARCPAHL
ncbi:MAG: hypothetical protein J2P57_13885 [Acidimicrobiaceae bacterium]|nr:hypothetical protein [Acidimicrobiaceae bacterium]